MRHRAVGVQMRRGAKRSRHPGKGARNKAAGRFYDPSRVELVSERIPGLRPSALPRLISDNPFGCSALRTSLWVLNTYDNLFSGVWISHPRLITPDGVMRKRYFQLGDPRVELPA